MKTMKTLAMTGLLLSSFVHAQVIGDTTHEINAQTTITRAAIDNVISIVNKPTQPTGFNATDYQGISSRFRMDVEYALKRFESRMQKEIFDPASALISQWNSIHGSTQFSDQQKSVILGQRTENIKVQFKLLSAKYQEILKEVFKMAPVYDLNLTSDISGEHGVSCTHNNDQTSTYQIVVATNRKLSWKATELKVKCAGYYGENTELSLGGATKTVMAVKKDGNSRSYFKVSKLAVHDFLLETMMGKELFQKLIYKPLKGECKSSLCVSLRASDFSTFVTSVNQKMNRWIPLKVASGAQFYIEPLSYDPSFISKAYQIVHYPETLPFDI